jgi:hypothetical protein
LAAVEAFKLSKEGFLEPDDTFFTILIIIPYSRYKVKLKSLGWKGEVFSY